jgi:hypothetical protein
MTLCDLTSQNRALSFEAYLYTPNCLTMYYREDWLMTKDTAPAGNKGRTRILIFTNKLISSRYDPHGLDTKITVNSLIVSRKVTPNPNPTGYSTDGS